MPSFFIITYLVYIAIFVVIFYLIYTWVTRYLRLKQEQNEILRDLVKKLGTRDNPDK